MDPAELASPSPGAAPIRRLPVVAGSVYLTFDDGPDPHWTPRVLEQLARRHAHASFFVVGQLAQRFAPLLRDAHAAGHAIGNHGWSHRHPWTLGASRARREVADGADAIAQLLGANPHWYRPPHGRLTPWLAASARAERERIALWSLSAVDWGSFGTPERIVRRVATARSGDIVLLHDGPWLQNRPAATLRALPAILDRLAAQRLAPLRLPDATLAA